MAKVNREFKSELFAYIFGREENKKWALSLYNAMNHTHITEIKELQIITIEDYIYLGMKNDVALLISNVLEIIEHQSTFNPNMPVRELMYAARLYDKYLQINEYNRYSSKRIPLPIPHLVVFYNGTDDKSDQLLRLSDSFDDQLKNTADIEVTVHMYNINYKYNSELLKQCKPLEEYSWFINQVRTCCDISSENTFSDEITKTNIKISIEEAVGIAIDEMPTDFLIRPFLLTHKTEVIGMMFMDYNEEETMRLVRKEALEDGSNEVFRAMDLINSGINSLKGLIEAGIPEHIAQATINKMCR